MESYCVPSQTVEGSFVSPPDYGTGVGKPFLAVLPFLGGRVFSQAGTLPFPGGRGVFSSLASYRACFTLSPPPFMRPLGLRVSRRSLPFARVSPLFFSRPRGGKSVFVSPWRLRSPPSFLFLFYRSDGSLGKALPAVVSILSGHLIFPPSVSTSQNDALKQRSFATAHSSRGRSRTFLFPAPSSSTLAMSTP